MSWYRTSWWVVAILAMGGCAGGDEATPSGQASPPAATFTVTETVTVSPSTPSPTINSKAPVSLPPTITLKVVEQGLLSSPSGNIWCALEYGIECIVLDHTYDPLSGDCGGVGDWVDSRFSVTEDHGVRGGCQSDTLFGDGQPPPLAYGTTALMGGHACQSTTTAMICWDIESEHGFRVSRTSYELF